MRRARFLRWGLAVAGIAALFAATAVGVSARGTHGKRQAKTITIAFVYDGPKTDGGWSQGHDQSRLAMEKALNGQVKTIYIESVPYGKKMLDVWNQLVARHVDAIIDTTAAGKPFVDFCRAHATLHCATTYPALGPEPKNVSNFYVSHWLGSYLAGVAAGVLT